MKYFIIENGLQAGPYSIYELKDKGLSSETLVWCEGLKDWTPAWQVAELKRFLEAGDTLATPPPYHPGVHQAAPEAPGPQSAACQQSAQPQPAAVPPVRRKSRVGCWIAALMFVIVLLALVLTCPGKADHQAKIKENVMLAFSKQQPDGNDLFSAGLKMMGQLLANGLVTEVLDKSLDYHNYFVFSTTSVRLLGETHTVSYGFLGKVFTASEADITKAIEAAGKALPGKAPMAVPGTATDKSNADNASGDLKDKVINSVGNMVKDKVKEETDSTTGESLGKLIDEVVGLFKD